VISGFCHSVDEKCAPLGYYAASSGNTILSFWDNPSLPSARVKNPFFLVGFLTLEDGTNRLSQNSKELPLLAA
jgi:hypothetical protein